MKSSLGLSNPRYQYTDEDNELISVDVDLELAEALRFIAENNTFLIVEDRTMTGSAYQFIDDLPLM